MTRARECEILKKIIAEYTVVSNRVDKDVIRVLSSQREEKQKQILARETDIECTRILVDCARVCTAMLNRKPYLLPFLVTETISTIDGDFLGWINSWLLSHSEKTPDDIVFILEKMHACRWIEHGVSTYLGSPRASSSLLPVRYQSGQ